MNLFGDWLGTLTHARRFARRRDPAGRRSEAVRAARHIRRGDRLRDVQRYAEAAQAYHAALGLTPLRTDIRVQYGNMLKDAGRLADAESAYRIALAEKPDDRDIYLQLGHLLKLQGRRADACEAYRRAAQLAAFSNETHHELFQTAQRGASERPVAVQSNIKELETLTEVANQLLELRETLDRLCESLPDIRAHLAFPTSCYDRFRALYDVPSPPWSPIQRTFAVLLLADREPLETLYAQLAAIQSQTRANWTLHVLGTDPARQRVIERAAASDRRILWVPIAPQEEPAQAERRIALSSDADWILLLADKALLHRRAIEWFSAVVGLGNSTAFVTDEETGIYERGSVRRSSPELRQVVDYDTLLEMNVWGQTIAVERPAYASLANSITATSVSASRSSLLLALAYDGQVGHIPCPLIWHAGETTVDPVHTAAAHKEAVLAHIQRNALAERIDIGPPTGSLGRLPVFWRPSDLRRPIALIIPTRDNGLDLRHIVDSLIRTAAVPDALHFVIVDNASREVETRCILAEIAVQRKTQVLSVDEPFNWSRLNNQAVQAVDCSLLVFANDDMLMLSERWDERLRGLLERTEIGAVGARLLYPDDTLQHAGVVFGWKGSVGHDGRHEASLKPGPTNRWHLNRAVGAVTGAFLATRRDVFLDHQGFDEVGLAVSYSDIDYALKLRRSGLKILWTPDITLYHHESKTRGLDHLDPEKQARDAAERAVMEARWGAAMLADPSVNPLWDMATQPFRLLSSPSQSRLWAHIERCARANPWLPEVKGPASINAELR